MYNHKNSRTMEMVQNTVLVKAQLFHLNKNETELIHHW